MSIYTKKQRWKLVLLSLAVLIGAASLWYTNNLVEELSKEERKKVELWAKGTKQLVGAEDPNQDLSFILEVITNNETVPVILVDENDNIQSYRNLDALKSRKEDYLKKQLEIMRKQNEPIEIILTEGHKNFIYYKESTLLAKLFYYPFIQLGIIFLFIIIAYFAFSASRKAEQNQVWVGMAKETAHQLGTPISSLMAWVEYLKLKQSVDEAMISDVEKDIKRLETITERFSKIGSAPVLKDSNIVNVLETSVGYIKKRTSDKVKFEMHFPAEELLVPINIPLFEWVIENLCKNAIDAMGGAGQIDVFLENAGQEVLIDIQDTGKGIAKSKQKTIFQPGFTTKPRGWGLGLSLVKRIIEFYHAGKIYVKSSEIDKGTTFRIVLKK